MTNFSASQRDRARRFLSQNPPPGRVVLCAVTGSHIYGFTSPDSDIDLKGIHLAPTVSLLGMHPPADNHDRLTIFEGVECDLTTHEAGRALAWLLKGNGNMLERIFSPLQLTDNIEELEALRGLARGALSQQSYSHYAGFFKGMQRESLLQQDAPRAKTLLYSYRVALTGIHLLQHGEVVTDLPQLAALYGYPEVGELIAIKREGQEKSALTPDQAATYRAAWPRLEAALAAARATSVLPESPQNADAIEDWLVRTREAALLQT